MRETLDPDTVASIDRTTTVREEKGFVQRMAEAISPTAMEKFRQGQINKYNTFEILSNDVAKTFGSHELLADTSAIAAALFSDRAAGVAASSFKNGIPVYRKGFTTVSDLDGQVKGLITALEPLAKYGDPYVFQAFQFYAATRRGKRLTAEGREKLFTADDIKRGEFVSVLGKNGSGKSTMIRLILKEEIAKIFAKVRKVKPRPAWTGSNTRIPSTKPPVEAKPAKVETPEVVAEPAKKVRKKAASKEANE